MKAKQLLVSAAAAFLAWSGAAPAQQFPSKPVRLIVPFPPGGGADIMARIFSDRLTQRLGQQVIVDNRPGANGNIGMELAAKAPPDGHTLIVATVGTWAASPFLYKLPYDVVRDFAPVIQVSTSPGILVVHPSVPAKNVKELVALARANPGKLDYGSAGIGGFGHISAALFSLLTGTEMVHVPYKGAGPATQDLMSGQIQVLFNDAIATVPHMKSGRMKALAVTSTKRMPIVPDLPTIDESGVKGYDNSSWMAMAAPAATPKETVARLNTEMAAILKTPDVQERVAGVGAIPVGGTPEQFSAYLKSELAKFERVVKAGKLK